MEEIQAQGVEERKLLDLADHMSAEELEQVTQEGLAANPPLTLEQEAAAQQKAQQMESYMNYLKQQRFSQFMTHRPQPASIRRIDWALLRFLLIIAEKEEFNHIENIDALNDMQWYHGIVTGNISVYKDYGTQDVHVSLRQEYAGFTTNLKPAPLADAFAAAKQVGNRVSRRRAQQRAASGK